MIGRKNEVLNHVAWNDGKGLGLGQQEIKAQGDQGAAGFLALGLVGRAIYQARGRKTNSCFQRQCSWH